jgi:hypothetical protein
VRKQIPPFRASIYCLLTIVALTVAACPARAAGAPLEEWHWRNPLPQGNALHNVVFVNGTYVAVGELGTILISNDGTNWLRRESGVIEDLRDCAYGGGHYTIVGDFGTVLTSLDAVSWTSQYAGTFYSLNGITYAGGQFVAVGEQTTILTSPDGTVWTPRSSGIWELFDIVQAEGLYVAVGGIAGTVNALPAGVILTSPDGRIWTRRAPTLSQPCLSVAYGAGLFAIVSQNQYGTSVVLTSDDGVNWQSNDTGTQYSLAGLAYGNGTWVAVVGSIDYPSYGVGTILASDNMLDWSEVYSNAFPINGVVFGGGRFIASRGNGTFLISSNGLNWANPFPESLPLFFQDLKYLNGTFVGIDWNQIVFSTDGTVWTNIAVLSNTNSGFDLASICYGNGRYVAGGAYRTVWTSTDGLTWTNPAPELNEAPYSSDVVVAYGNGVFVGAAGYQGDILTSPDGLNWTLQQLQTNAYPAVSFRDVTFGQGRFVAVAQNAIATSSDGTNWNFAMPDNSNLTGVASGNGRFVAIGANVIMTSSDGTNWVAQNSTAFGQMTDIAFGDGFFAATAGFHSFTSPRDESLIWISTDGVHWSKRSSRTPLIFFKIAFGNGTFVLGGSLLGGSAGAILQSDPLVNLAMTMQAVPQLFLWGPTNRPYRIEYLNGINPSNTWMPLTTVVPSESPAQFSDVSWTNSANRFYRAVLLP